MKPNLGLSPTLRLHWPASENEIREPSRRHQNPLTRACQRLEGDGRPLVHTNGALCSATHRPPPQGHTHALPSRSCSAQGPIEEHTPRRILRGRAQSAGGARRCVRPRGVPVNQEEARLSKSERVPRPVAQTARIPVCLGAQVLSGCGETALRRAPLAPQAEALPRQQKVPSDGSSFPPGGRVLTQGFKGAAAGSPE